VTAGASVAVTRWGELPAERKPPGVVLRVLVAGEHAGGAELCGGSWAASWRTAGNRGRVTEHATAEDAVRAVIRSGWARHLGARAASRVTWSDRARRTVARVNRPGGLRVN
jgi:hypothetical protein